MAYCTAFQINRTNISVGQYASKKGKKYWSQKKTTVTNKKSMTSMTWRPAASWRREWERERWERPVAWWPPAPCRADAGRRWRRESWWTWRWRRAGSGACPWAASSWPGAGSCPWRPVSPSSGATTSPPNRQATQGAQAGHTLAHLITPRVTRQGTHWHIQYTTAARTIRLGKCFHQC